MAVKLESLFSELHSVLAEEQDGENLIHAASLFIGPSGGELQAKDTGVYIKHKINIPSGALVNTFLFTVDDPIDRSIFPTYTQRTAAQWMPHPTPFNSPVTLTIEYQSITDLPPGSREIDLVPLIWDGEVFIPIDAPFTVDTTNETISVTINGISQIGIYGIGVPGHTSPNGQTIGGQSTWIHNSFW